LWFKPQLRRNFYFRFREVYGKTFLLKVASLITAVIWYFNKKIVSLITKNLIFAKIRHVKSCGVLLREFMGVKTVALSQQHLSTFLWENELYSPKLKKKRWTNDRGHNGWMAGKT